MVHLAPEFFNQRNERLFLWSVIFNGKAVLPSANKVF